METLNFSAKVRRRVEQMGITLAELARRCGMSRSTLNSILVHNRVGKTIHLLSLSRALHVSADYLLDDSITDTAQAESTEEEIVRLSRAIGPDKTLRLLMDVAEIDKDRFSHDWGNDRLPSANNHDGGKG